MRTKNESRAGRGRKARKSRITGAQRSTSLLPCHVESANPPRPLFVFNVKLFDDGLLPPVLKPPSAWPHRYVVVIRRPDGTVQGDGPLRTRLEAEMAANRARFAVTGNRVHLVVAPDEREDELDAFFADPLNVAAVAEEGARARERYEEWRRQAGPVRPSYGSSAARPRPALSPVFQ